MSTFKESRSLGRERKLGGIFRLKLNVFSSPIAYKYREGKMKSTLKREFNAPETAAVQALQTSLSLRLVGWLVSVGRFGVSRLVSGALVTPARI